MQEEQEQIRLTKYDLGRLRNNSLVTIIGPQTNHKLLFKIYGKHFTDYKQFSEILTNLPPNHFLVVDQTSPHNKIENMVFYMKYE